MSLERYFPAAVWREPAGHDVSFLRIRNTGTVVIATAAEVGWFDLLTGCRSLPDHLTSLASYDLPAHPNHQLVSWLRRWIEIGLLRPESALRARESQQQVPEEGSLPGCSAWRLIDDDPDLLAEATPEVYLALELGYDRVCAFSRVPANRALLGGVRSLLSPPRSEEPTDATAIGSISIHDGRHNDPAVAIYADGFAPPPLLPMCAVLHPAQREVHVALWSCLPQPSLGANALPPSAPTIAVPAAVTADFRLDFPDWIALLTVRFVQERARRAGPGQFEEIGRRFEAVGGLSDDALGRYLTQVADRYAKLLQNRLTELREDFPELSPWAEQVDRFLMLLSSSGAAEILGTPDSETLRDWRPKFIDWANLLCAWPSRPADNLSISHRFQGMSGFDAP